MNALLPLTANDATATRYPDVQRILDEAVAGQEIGAHTAFWRGMDRDTFVQHKVFGCPILLNTSGTFDGPGSPLVRILRGPISCPPPRDRPQMPVGFPAVLEERVQIISDWIDAQCPA
jgi:hypothetical protein